MTEFLFPTHDQAQVYLRTAGFKPLKHGFWIDYGKRRSASIRQELDCARVVVIHPNG